MSTYVKRNGSRWDAWHITSGRYMGSFPDEVEATRAAQRGTSVAGMFERMIADGVLTDSDGKPIDPQRARLPEPGPESDRAPNESALYLAIRPWMDAWERGECARGEFETAVYAAAEQAIKKRRA